MFQSDDVCDEPIPVRDEPIPVFHDEPCYYNFMWDETQVLQFAKDILGLPTKKQDEVFVIVMAAKKPYFKMSDQIFDRSTVNSSNPKVFLNIVKSYQVEEGLYIDANKKELIMEELAIYSMINPQDSQAAAVELIKVMIDTVNDRSIGNLETLAKTALHESIRWLPIELGTKKQGAAIEKTLRTLMYDMLDAKEPPTTQNLVAQTSELKIIESCGGFYFLVPISFNSGKLLTSWEPFCPWLKEFKFKPLIDEDPYIPVPGTVEGNFKVRFVTTLLIFE